MTAKLIVVSSSNQRLTVQAQPFAVRSVPATGDSYTSLIVQHRVEAKLPIQAKEDDDPPPPPPDIDMSFVTGLPTGISTDDIANAEKVTGPITADKLREHLDGVAPDAQKILVLELGNGD